MTAHDLPGLNACLNTTAAVLLVAGWVNIRRRRRAAHRACMLAALAASGLFLVFYLVYHAQVGSVRFPLQGWLRPVYFTILISHTVLAAAIVPLVLVTLRRAFRAEYPRHALVARWTLPLWLYVSVSGVAVYWLLYRVAGAVPG
jgi:uncharacterized membrane protein YozB (DUF420 family)